MKRKYISAESLTPIRAGTVSIISIPGASKPWFVYDSQTRKCSHGFKTYRAAEQYIKREFKSI